MQVVLKIKQRCGICTHKIKKGDTILIKKDNTVVHKDCLDELKKKK